MPLNEDVESSHRESQPCFEIFPNSVSQMFEMENHGEHGKQGFNEHSGIPGFGLTHFQVLRIDFFGIEVIIYQNDHLFFKGLDQWMKCSVMHIGSSTIPATNQPTWFNKQQTLWPTPLNENKIPNVTTSLSYR